jgi:hypothetical protein
MYMSYNYTTKFYTNPINKELLPYYQIIYKKKKIGILPAEINFEYKNQLYSTASLLTLLFLCHKNNKFPTNQLNLSVQDWYKNKNKPSKMMFIKITKQLQLLSK